MQNSLLERIVQFPAQRNVILHSVLEAVEILTTDRRTSRDIFNGIIHDFNAQ